MNLPKPLAGVRVLDFTWVRAGPWGTRWLGALGAEIVKIEWPPITTNQGRAGNGSHPKGMQRTLNTRGGFNDTNCNKVCVTLNARSAKGMEQVRRLVTLSDIVIENFSTGAMEAWGLGYQELRKLRPDIIYVSMSGFGQTGRHRDYTTMGPIAQALSGLTLPLGPAGRATGGDGAGPTWTTPVASMAPSAPSPPYSTATRQAKASTWTCPSCSPASH